MTIDNQAIEVLQQENQRLRQQVAALELEVQRLRTFGEDTSVRQH